MRLAQPIQPRCIKGCLTNQAKSKLGDNAMYMERLLPAAREKLFTIADDAPLTEAASSCAKGLTS